MTLEQLRIFVGVAEREHMTRAAEALNVTQSAASGAIAALEGRYGVPLFHRVGRGIQLTEAGRGFLDEARSVRGRAAHAGYFGVGQAACGMHQPVAQPRPVGADALGIVGIGLE